MGSFPLLLIPLAVKWTKALNSFVLFFTHLIAELLHIGDILHLTSFLNNVIYSATKLYLLYNLNLLPDRSVSARHK